MFLKKFDKSCKVVLILSAISFKKLSYYIITLLAYSNMRAKERDKANVILVQVMNNTLMFCNYHHLQN